MPTEVAVRVLDSPHGPVNAAATETGIAAIALWSSADVFRTGLARLGLVARLGAGSTRGAASHHLRRLELLLEGYWAGSATDLDVPLDLRVRSPWDRRILAAVATIPFGQTLSYGGVAARAGAPRAARAAGGAIGRNPIAILVPCHRVIAGDGSIGGYGGSWFGEREELLALKRSLLAGEGVMIP